MRSTIIIGALGLIGLGAVGACGTKASPSSGQGAGSGSGIAAASLPLPAGDGSDGLDIRLSNGQRGAAPYDRAKLAPATSLSESATQQLLARTKAIVAQTTDKAAFALRPRSQPVPRTGQVIAGKFPPDPSSLLPPAAGNAGGALTVVRYMPEGPVPLAPQLTVTFSQPMVAVTSQSDAAAITPVKLHPAQTPGQWRWIGTRTIVFDPTIRFPQATTYQIEIPAGTTSATGGKLAAPVTFSFETPPPSIVSSYPSSGEPQHLDEPIVLLFDQKVDPQAVAAKLRVTANGTVVPMRIMTAAEIAAAKPIAAVVDAAKTNEQDGRWVAVRPVGKYPADTLVTVSIPAGTVGAEGPNPTKLEQHVDFRTYPPLRLTRAECGYDGKCPPGNPFSLEVTNPLDPARSPESQITVTPAIADMHVVVQGRYVQIQGDTVARTRYSVKVKAAIADEFGQTLGSDEMRDILVTDAQPAFYGPSGFVVADPLAKQPTLDFFSTGYSKLAVKLYQVSPADLKAFAVYTQESWNRDHPPTPPGRKVFDSTVATSTDPNKLVETAVNLEPALVNHLGHVLAIVEPSPWTESYAPPRLTTWVQVTQLGLEAHVDGENLIAYVSDLQTGKPATGVALQIEPFDIHAVSDATGLATMPLAAPGPPGAHLLVARRGSDVAVLPERAYAGDYGSWTRQERGVGIAWYVADDRHLYKPGEEVTLKGWLRTIDSGKGGDVGMAPGMPTRISYVVFDSRHNQIGQGSVPVSAVGGFDTKIPLPKTPNLGTTRIEMTASGGIASSYTHAVQVEEFRRPEFEVTAEASQGPFLVRGSGDVTVKAKYFSGGPLPGAPVTWSVTASPTSFTPPNRDDFTFGTWTPWWGERDYGSTDENGDEGGYGRGGGGGGSGRSWNLTGQTDAIGAHTLKLDFLSVKPAVPMSVTANATVMDVNRQAWSASSTLLVHPAAAYVGLKTKQWFVEKGKPYVLDVIGVDLDGKALPGAAITVHAVRLDWEYKQGRYVTKEVEPQDCAVKAGAAPLPCTFQTPTGGSYKVTARITDSTGRANETSLSFWVAGGERPRSRDVTQEKLEIIPDKQEYTAGNTAELLVQSPFYPAEGIVTWRRSGIVKTERITFDGPTKVVTVPITDGMVPNLVVQVDLVGATERLDDHGDADPTLPKRPAFAEGSINLPIPPKSRTLAVTVTPAAAKLAPGESTKLAVTVRDATGAAVPGAEAAVMVVDEAILALAAYDVPDPIGAFYRPREAGARDFHSRAFVKLANPDHGVARRQTVSTSAPGSGAMGKERTESSAAMGTVAMMDQSAVPNSPPPAAMQPSPGEPMKPGESDKNKSGSKYRDDFTRQGASATTPIAVRSNFAALAAFAPAVVTDAQGNATVDLKLPDSLTRYRVIAIATQGNRFGKGENAVTARLPLMVRPSPPRFLNFGDTFQLPVVVQNQTDAPMTVQVAVRTTNVTLTAGGGRQVTVPANDRVAVQFPAAAELAGTARIQVLASSGSVADAAELALPVWTPATTEAFATYGTIDDGAIAQPVALPGAVVKQFGGLEITTSSTTLQSLTDAVLYLVHYPYECSEQRSSRILAIAALRDVLAAFQSAEMPSAAEIEASMTKDLAWIAQVQNADGGFAFWERGRESEPYLTAFVANALVRAQTKGYAVPPGLLEKVKPYLADIESHYPAAPYDYPLDVQHSISAFALYTRKLMGDVDIAKGQRLIRDAGGVEKLPMEANGWLLSLMAGNADAKAQRDAITRYALNHVAETAGAANFTTSYSDGGYLLLASDRRVDAVMLEALILDNPASDLIPKLVTGLLAHRKAGKWLNTQENVYALLAMDLYFQTYEKATPNFIARVWLGADYAGDHPFKGRSTESFGIDIPMVDVAAHDHQSLTIQKDGTGRLYYRIGMTYAPASLKLDAADYGFVVARSYEGADAASDVVKQADGTWKIKAGARVRVRLRMVNENRRYHVALVDPVPAGLEPMNPALATTGPVPPGDRAAEEARGGRYWWWYGPWYEHQNMRDERVEAFTELLWEGVHEYEYVARATTPGTFVVPPPKAEEMYMPETFGRGASDRVIVE